MSSPLQPPSFWFPVTFNASESLLLGASEDIYKPSVSDRSFGLNAELNLSQ